MTEADAIRDAVRLADEERAKLTDQVQEDRREDAPPERTLTTDRVRKDRQSDLHITTDQIQQDRRDDEAPERKRTTDQIQQDRRDDQAPERKRTTDQIQQDRRDDEAPRTALELVRADKLTQSLALLEAVRRMCQALLVVMVVLGMAMVFLFDYMGDLRGEIKTSNQSTDRVEKAFVEFSDNNQAYLDNHSRTQRLICDWFRVNHVALPDNGDCDNR